MTGSVLFAVLALLSAERALELVLNRRHVRWLREHGATFHERDGFGLILLAQVLLFLLLAFEVLAAPWARIGWWTWPLLGAALAAQGLRYWVIRTLGPRWCIRVVTLPGQDRILGGPYRYLRHPNYLAVAIEALALPLAFAAFGTALLVAPLQWVALLRRIRREDAALRAAPHAAAPAGPARAAE